MADRQTVALVIATAALVPSIYGAAMPPLAEVRAKNDSAGHLGSAEHYAAVTALVVVLGIGFSTQTPAVIVGGGLAVLAFHHVYATAAQVPA